MRSHVESGGSLAPHRALPVRAAPTGRGAAIRQREDASMILGFRGACCADSCVGRRCSAASSLAEGSHGRSVVILLLDIAMVLLLSFRVSVCGAASKSPASFFLLRAEIVVEGGWVTSCAIALSRPAMAYVVQTCRREERGDHLRGELCAKGVGTSTQGKPSIRETRVKA